MNHDPQKNQDLKPRHSSWAFRLTQFVWADKPLFAGLAILLGVIPLVATRVLPQTDALLIVFCLLVCGFVILVWRLGNHIEKRFKLRSEEKPQPQAVKTAPTSNGWQTVILIGVAFAIARGLRDNNEPKGPYSHVPMLTPTTLPNQSQGRPSNAASLESPARVRRPQATLSYWQNSVASLQELRFSVPTGNEPAGKVVDDMFARLRMLADKAQAAPITDVDQDLVNMVRQLLDVDRGFLRLKAEADELSKQKRIPTDAVSVDQRMSEWQQLLLAVQTNPNLLESLPESPERTLIERTIALEQKRVDQLKQIEIMQAVLQERYPGTMFPLPNLDR